MKVRFYFGVFDTPLTSVPLSKFHFHQNSNLTWWVYSPWGGTTNVAI